jgi:hypothetical protein
MESKGTGLKITKELALDVVEDPSKVKNLMTRRENTRESLGTPMSAGTEQGGPSGTQS